jgi:hypothetical protein
MGTAARVDDSGCIHSDEEKLILQVCQVAILFINFVGTALASRLRAQKGSIEWRVNHPQLKMFL